MSSLLALPTELLTQICLFLPLPRDTKSLASTCRGLQNKLTVPSNYLWFTFLTTLPLLRHKAGSIYKPGAWNPPPVCAVTGKFDYRVNYYARALSILRGRIFGCFDCFNLNKRSLRNIYIGKIYYRTYCASCYQEYFWPITEFDVYWPEIDIPPSLIADEQAENSFSAIHYRDAIFLITDQLPPRARGANGRFLSKWEFQVRALKQSNTGDKEKIWDKVDYRMIRGTEMDGIIKLMLWIYQSNVMFKTWWVLGDKEWLREYLEENALKFLKNISTIRLNVAARARFSPMGGADVLLWALAEAVLKADDEHTGETGWTGVEGGRKGYLVKICEEYMRRIFGLDLTGRIQAKCRLLFERLEEYKIERVGKGRDEDKHRPFFCQFCKEEEPGEKAIWDLSYAGTRVLDPLERMSELMAHIFTRHNDRFKERWVTGGGVIEPMAKKWEPAWRNLTALHAPVTIKLNSLDRL